MAATVNIEKHNITLPNSHDNGKLAFFLLNVFTPEECQQWIELTEKRGYSPALINIGKLQVLMTGVRNNDRCIIDDVAMAQTIFERIESYLPKEWKTHQLVGLNERLRFLRYDPGQKFKPHLDGEYARNDESLERSYITVQLYLNENFQGGETTFVHNTDSSKNVACIPRTGMVLIFQHDILHEGSTLIKDRKYTVRTDAMYRPLKKMKSSKK
ncbi:unnamed protein product [Rotaria magnacalcarata]|uniref:Prolyl 4-hydroxylase alpha subunit domain-containing protein n=1 Tax=Rotaria magnacalcarata TaxID=392030 RepID=A0A819NR80_9BILA|nr:unnamed protein product [Rotaria magnacalcarata]CAF2098700.1 unnamed protein product [Rotaria magnacalcarata]CAF2103628.1 unnamed protein product [Rotaria magnacalcarata]CAF2228927.1 unnamed protein product [Rotaria magnacalcarata]CAF3826528.1 unnamed protein product [Rotaria magnacalcarata]